MDTYNKCIIVGLITMCLWLIMLIIIYNKKVKDFNIDGFVNNKGKYPNIKMGMLISFVIGYSIHYIIEYFNMYDYYCEKRCYDDGCYDICIK